MLLKQKNQLKPEQRAYKSNLLHTEIQCLSEEELATGYLS